MAVLRSVALWGFVIFCKNSVVGSGFCYSRDDCVTKPYRWPGQCQTGKRQSPIDIPVSPSHFQNAPKSDLLLSDGYFEPRDFIAKNNGLNVEVEVQVGEKLPCTLNGTLVDNENYNFAELNFRWGRYGNPYGSEHSVNGTKYAMELHMVHYKSFYEDVYQAAASTDASALSILTVFFKICIWDNPTLESIIEALGNIQRAGSEKIGSGLVLAKLLEISSEPKVQLMQYDGSTTIPNCTEAVVWNVFKVPQCISMRQLNAYSATFMARMGNLLVTMTGHYRNVTIEQFAILRRPSRLEMVDARVSSAHSLLLRIGYSSRPELHDHLGYRSCTYGSHLPWWEGFQFYR